jgi:hypothetical protein
MYSIWIEQVGWLIRRVDGFHRETILDQIRAKDTPKDLEVR